MLTSEQYRCPNEKRNFSAAPLNANPLNWSVDQNYTVAELRPALWMSPLSTDAMGKAITG
jgi:hypothetical protein